MKRAGVVAAIACVIVASVVRAEEGELEVAPPPTEVALEQRAEPVVDDRFVRVSGTRFVVGGAPFHFVGANVGVVHGLPHRAAMERTLDAVRADGLRVIRVWALGERAEDAPAWARDFAFRTGEEGWIATSFEHLDRVIDAARARDLRVIVVLANRWRDYGGVPQYLRWAGVPFDEASADAPGGPGLAQFFDCTRCDALYRAHVRRVVERVSSTSGIAYRDEPTILAWELMNESSVPARSAPALVRWTQESARFIRSLDPNHLIAAGHIGYERGADRDTWLAIQRLPEIDYADAHAYPAAYQRVRDVRELTRWIDDRVQLAHHVARKPFVFGEFGFSTRHLRVLGVPRARWYDAFLRAGHRDGIAGALVWTYLPYEDRPTEHGIHPEGEGERRTRDVRAVLARHARRWAITPPEERNPRLGESIGETPIHPASREARGTSQVHDAWSDGVLRMPIEGFRRAAFEGVGRWDGGAVVHLWGSGRGWVRYEFRSDRGSAPSRLVLRVRASSELPGLGIGATAEDGSRVSVSIDEVALGTIDLPPDDGIGRVVELVVDDAELLARVFARPRSRHSLRFEVVPGVGAEGLCLYGAATGREALAPEVLAELPGAIELTYER
ncbi:glycoside hydrolase 5 family protein [Sandaracinus amylolyticus]|uniref:mannan endo-1,4-beta-mannosidase n=1 Tax=Sandaracinus amylolyticus TaxID=927083 RepID=A0A0F6YHQ2_9BACT|nr:cellulase family glycosylhydrolase [Sandaracinus amylolyticus]AKF04963.1 Endo-1,4-beta-mannosidase [Sandaracinus amylolyticus]